MGAENALLRIELGQQAFPMAALSDSGDATKFTGQAAPWSGRAGYEPDVKPDGLINGGAVTPGAAANTLNVEAISCNLGGAQTVVAGQTGVAITRATTATHLISSVTVTAAGEIAVVAGTEGTAFSETRGAAGGPPEVPEGSIELGQVRLGAQAAAVVVAAEIFQVPGLHQERFDFPLYSVDSFKGAVQFKAELPKIHAGGTTKGVYASYAKPIMADVDPSKDVVLPEETFSVGSEEYYGTSIGSVSRSLGQASFKTPLTDGINDPLVKLSGEKLWALFLPNRYKSADGEMFQGILGVKRNFPTSGAITGDCTMSCEKKSERAEGL